MSRQSAIQGILSFPLRLSYETYQWFTKASKQYSPEVLTLVIAVYLAQGARSYVDVSASWLGNYHYRDLSVGDIEVGSNLVLLSWSLKVIWGLIFDNLPIRRRHSRPYLLIASVFGFVGFLGISFDSTSPTWTSFLAFSFLLQWGGSASDVLVDGLVVKSSRTDGKGNSADLQVLCWVTMAIGNVLSSLIGGRLATPFSASGEEKLKLFKEGKITESERYSTPTDSLRWYFRMMLILPVFVFLIALQYNEPKSKVQIAWRPILSNFSRVLKTLLFTPAVLQPMLWFFFHNMCQISTSSSWNLYTTQVLRLTPSDLSFIQTISVIFTIIGTLSYARYFKRTPYRTIFFWSQLGVVVLNFCSYVLTKRWNLRIGISDYPFLLLQSCVDQVVSRLNLMPFLILAAQVCPLDMENTFFSLIMSLSNLTAGPIKSIWTKPLLDSWNIRDGNFDNFPSVVLVNFGLSILPLTMVWMLPTFSSVLTDEQRAEYGLPMMTGRKISDGSDAEDKIVLVEMDVGESISD